MPKFRITAYAEWFFAETIEAESVAAAQEQMTELLRGRSLNPCAGPGIQFTNHRRIGDDVTAEEDPR
jgi:hypothetical protein